MIILSPLSPTQETDGAAAHQQLPGHLGAKAIALCCQSPITKPRTSFVAICDAEGHTTRDGKRLAGALVSPTSSLPAAFLKALAAPKDSRKKKLKRKLKKEKKSHHWS